MHRRTVVWPVHDPSPVPPAAMNTPQPPSPSDTRNWELVGLVAVGLIHASKVSCDAGAKAAAYVTVGCTVSDPVKYSEAVDCRSRRLIADTDADADADGDADGDGDAAAAEDGSCAR